MQSGGLNVSGYASSLIRRTLFNHVQCKGKSDRDDSNISKKPKQQNFKGQFKVHNRQEPHLRMRLQSNAGGIPT